MAAGTKTFVQDYSSAPLEQLRKEFNALLTEIAAAADYAALKTALANVNKVLLKLTLPAAPANPLTPGPTD